MPRKQKKTNPHANAANKPAIINRHTARTEEAPWWQQCAAVDVTKLRAELSVEFIRLRQPPGLTHTERQALRDHIAELQRPKERRARRLELQREREAL